MYDLGDILPDAELESGSNVLVSGPPLTGKRRLALEVLATGADRGEGAIVVTTKDDAQKIVSEFDRLALKPVDDLRLGIVDCVTQQRGIDTADDSRVRYASSPVDMTGIGIKLSEFLQEFYQTRGIERNRVLLHSISTLLMYSDLQTVFRFLHVFTGRVQSADGLGLFVVDDSSHDEQTLDTLKQLFDAVLEVDEDDDGDTTVRMVGPGMN